MPKKTTREPARSQSTMSPLQIGLAGAAVVAALAVAFWPRHGSDEPATIDDAHDDDAHGTGSAPPANADPLAAPPDVAAPPGNAHHTASGLAYVVLRPGTGTR